MFTNTIICAGMVPPYTDINFNTIAFMHINVHSIGSDQGGLGPCQGDSGGPILKYSGLPEKKYTQLGIVFGAVSECGHSDFPAIFVNLEHPEIYWFVKQATGKDYFL